MIRTCPKCSAYYADQSLAFCLADGTPLIDVGNERWQEASRVIEEKTRASRKQLRRLMWRRIVLATLTTSMLAMVVSKSYVVETIPAGTIPPVTESLPSSPTPLPSVLPPSVSLLPSPSPSPSPSHSSSPSTSVTVVVYKISGRVIKEGQSLGGVSVTLDGSKSASTTTDANGNYTFSDLQAGGSYTITPRAKTNFTPSNRSFDNLGHDESADFSVLIEVFKISGRVTDAGQSIGGVKVRLEGSKATSTTTDGSGYYTFSDLRAGGSYTITPIRTKMNFTPQNRSFDNLTYDGSADFNGLRERESPPPPPVVTGPGEPDLKPTSKCTEADENRERKNIRGAYEAGWLNRIKDERTKVIAANVRDGEVAEAALRPSDPQISFFEDCKVAHVSIRYEWQLNTFFNGRPARVLTLPKQRRFICGRVLGGWFCKQI